MLQAEQIGDVDEGTPVESRDEFGFNAEERAAWDAMQAGPADGDGPAEPEPASDPEPTEPAPDAPPADPAAVAPPAEEDDDAPDVITTDPKTGKQQKTINYGKHQRLITKAQKQAEDARLLAEQQRVDNAKLAERLAILNEALMAPPPSSAPAAPAAPANPMLEPTINPAEDAIAALDQMQRRQVWLAESSMQVQEQTQEQLQDQQVVADFTRDTQTFARTEEGRHFFGDEGAYQFLKNSRLIELGISLFDKDPTDPNAVFSQTEINKMVADYNAEEKWVVTNALKGGKSPSMAIMKLARGRGWKAPAAAAPAPPAPAPAARAAAPAVPGLARPPAAAPPRAPAAAAPASAAAKLQAEIDGAAASRSLSDGGGSPPAEPLTPEALLRMNDEEFGRYVDSLPKDRLDAIMGKQFPGR